MKKYRRHLLFVFIFLLTACSSNSINETTVNKYKKANPLEADIVVPQSILVNESQLLKVVLRQNGEVVDGLKDVQFTISKKDNSKPDEVMIANNTGNGEYNIEKIFTEEGFYYVKVQASANGSAIMPTKQFLVGDIPKEELNDLNNTPETPNSNHEQHH